MNSRTRTVPKKLTCTHCQNVQIVHRPQGQNRPKGHIKHLWCPRCQMTIEHIESEER